MKTYECSDCSTVFEPKTPQDFQAMIQHKRSHGYRDDGETIAILVERK